jgi:hypothetical protein
MRNKDNDQSVTGDSKRVFAHSHRHTDVTVLLLPEYQTQATDPIAAIPICDVAITKYPACPGNSQSHREYVSLGPCHPLPNNEKMINSKQEHSSMYARSSSAGKQDRKKVTIVTTPTPSATPELDAEPYKQT